MTTKQDNTSGPVEPLWLTTVHSRSRLHIAVALLIASCIGGFAHADSTYPNALRMTPEIEEQMKSQKVPKFLAGTMFERIPDAKKIIRAVNLDRTDSHDVSYMMDPTDDTYQYEMGVTNNMSQLEMEEIQKPEYWVLLKLSTGTKAPSDDWYWTGGSTYSRIFGNLSDRIQREGVLHFATALQYNMWGNNMLAKNVHRHEQERERRLIKAAYEGLIGDDNHANPLFDDSYQLLPEVEEKYAQWEANGDLPFDSKEKNLWSAYWFATIDSDRVSDPHLASSAMIVLLDLYHERSDFKEQVVWDVYETLYDKRLMPNPLVQVDDGGYRYVTDIFED